LFSVPLWLCGEWFEVFARFMSSSFDQEFVRG
jgi:hypothetical protein